MQHFERNFCNFMSFRSKIFEYKELYPVNWPSIYLKHSPVCGDLDGFRQSYGKKRPLFEAVKDNFSYALHCSELTTA